MDAAWEGLSRQWRDEGIRNGEASPSIQPVRGKESSEKEQEPESRTGEEPTGVRAVLSGVPGVLRPGGQTMRSPISSRSRARTRDLATRTATGLTPSSAATVAGSD